MDEHKVEPQSEVELLAEPQREPVFNLPGSVLASLAILVAIYAVQTLLLSDNTVDWLFFNFGFIPLRYAASLAEQGLQPFWTPLTYSLLHGNIEHIVFNGLWLMAFGTPVARRIGTARYLIFWVFSSAAAAALHLGLNWGSPAPLVGASGVISGLMGAACRFAFPPERRPNQAAHLNPRLSVVETFRSRTVLMFIIFWFAGNILIASGVPIFGGEGQDIAWDAHIGGFLFGFLLFPLFDRAPPAQPVISEQTETLQS